MRVRLFNEEYPKGKLFVDPVELEEAEKSGKWVDAEWKVGKPKIVEPVEYINNDIIAKDVPEVASDPIKYCECGCGAVVTKRFVKGHSFRRKGVKHGNNSEHKPPD